MNRSFQAVLLSAVFLAGISQPNLRGGGADPLTVTRFVSVTPSLDFCFDLYSDGTFRVCGSSPERKGTYTKSGDEIVLKILVPSSGISPPIDVYAVRKLTIQGDALVDPKSGAKFVKVDH